MYLARLVEESPLTREAVAHASGIAEGRVSSLLNGKRAWYLEDIERIAAALDLDALDVLDAVAEMTRAHATVIQLRRRQQEPDGLAQLRPVAREGTVTGDDGEAEA